MKFDFSPLLYKIGLGVMFCLWLKPIQAQSLDELITVISSKDSLLKNANVIVRNDTRVFEVKDVQTATLKVQKKVTVLNRHGDDMLDFAVYSDRFQKLDDAEIIVYNAFGKKINSYRKKEMKTSGYGDGLVEDGMLTHMKISAPSYPITVEQKYTIKYNGILEYPDHYIQTPGVAVEQFHFEVKVPESLGLRHQELNTSITPTKKTANGELNYVWQGKNLPAMNRETYSGPMEHYFPKIIISPNKFKISGYEGDLSSWKNYGEWSRQLIADADILDKDAAAFFVNLTANATTEREKAALIYKYLQNNMRYVSVQLGIGGWKPFSANFVHQKKYGDCKALSNYMVAALKAVGIKSYYAIVNSGANAIPAQMDFPGAAFNHVILCIPQEQDSIWLECTSNTADFGKLGYFTENRNALLVTENGGVLVPTPRSSPDDHVLNSVTKINLLKDEATKLSTQIEGQGYYKQQQLGMMYQKPNDEKLKYFMFQLEWQQPDVLDIIKSDLEQSVFRIEADMLYRKLHSFKAGSKYFFPSRLYNLFDEEVVKNDKRTQDYYFYGPYTVNDTTVYRTGGIFSPEKLPENENLDYSFAQYTSRYHWDEAAQSITIISTLQIKQPHIPVASYGQLMEFKQKVDADLGQKIVLKLK